MKRQYVIYSISLALAMAFAATACVTAEVAERPDGPQRHALLVGVTHYPNIPGFDLRGPANDTELFKQVLQRRFDFPEENIVILSEPEGQQDPEKLPTRANIERQFQRLAQVAQPGDRVVIFMAGHGAQQPQPEDAEDWELDGMDEIFLPRDTQRSWDSNLYGFPGAIVDNEIGQWLAAILDKEASVWIVIDACHSGTMIRGADEQVRQVPLDENGLYIPPEVLAAARQRAQQRLAELPELARGHSQQVSILRQAEQPGIAAIYACQPHEVTIERNFPRFSPDARRYGLLTYTLCQILNRSQTPLTYNELVRRINDEYAAMGRGSPTALVEGEDRNREVLGDTVSRQPPIVVTRRASQLIVNAGSLHGLTPGSILAVYEPEEPEKVLGHVEVTAVRVHEANVVPCEYEDMAVAQEDDIVGRWCQPVFVDYGDLRIPVAVDPEDARGEPIGEAERQQLSRELQQLDQESQSLISKVAEPAEADWLVRWHQQQVYLIPAVEWSRGRETEQLAVAEGDDEQPELLGPIAADQRLGEWLNDSLTRIAQAENLKRLALAAADPVVRPLGDLGVEVEVEVRLHRGPDDEQGELVTWPELDRIRFFDGDRLTVWLRNPGRVPIDVTLLYVDSRYGIAALFPELGEYNRLLPDQSMRLPLEAQATTTGLEHMVAIAVRAEGPTVDFASLAQPTIELARGEARTRGAPTERAFDSPLGLMFQRGLYGQGERAMARQRDTVNYMVQSYSWYIDPERRPADQP